MNSKYSKLGDRQPPWCYRGGRTSLHMRATRRVAGNAALWSCISALVFLLQSASQVTAADREQARRPNVLVLVSDDQRPDTIGALGNPLIETPNLDALVRTGAVFTRAVCANPICTPSRAEIISGCSGFRNGVLDFGRVIDPQIPTWAQTMTAAGYRTWYVGKWHNNGRPKLHGYQATKGLFSGGGGRWWKDQVDHHGRPVTGYRGWIFQTSDGEKLPELGVGLTPNISASFANAAIEVIQTAKEEPFFLHVNFTAPHDPLLMPPAYKNKYDPDKIPRPKSFLPRHPFDHGNFEGRDEKLLPWPRTSQDVREDLAVYYAVISHLDEQIGRILDALRSTGQWEDTIVVFTSDHGLAMGSHGLRGKQNMYEHTINVPLILHGPGIPRGKRFAAQMYLRDMYPTVCELARVRPPQQIDGRSLVPVLEGKTKAIRSEVFCYFRHAQRMVRENRWKLIHYPAIDRYQLFDLQADPDELRDLSQDDTHAETVNRLKAKLRRWRESVEDPSLP